MTTVRPLSRDHIEIKLTDGFTCVTFRLNNGGAEAVILDPSGTECTRLAIAPPASGQQLEIIKAENQVTVLYTPKSHPILDAKD